MEGGRRQRKGKEEGDAKKGEGAGREGEGKEGRKKEKERRRGNGKEEVGGKIGWGKEKG